MAQDVVTALRWVYENADTYNLDQGRINLMGHSAGGHLIMLVGTNPKYLQANNLSTDIIHSLVDLDGPVDLEYFIQRIPSYKKRYLERIKKRVGCRFADYICSTPAASTFFF
ncbi:hypothetical protein GCM10020331_059200 [Ectobacillus funiculus]